MKNEISFTEWIKKQSRRRSSLFCVCAVIMIGICIIYGISMSQATIILSVATDPLKANVSVEESCHSAGNGVFLRDHLRKLVIDILDDNSAYVDKSDALKQPIISQTYSNLTQFIVKSREIILSRRLKSTSRSIPMIFNRPPFKDMVKPSCDGLWMEFGVFRGATLTTIANWKAFYCRNSTEPVYGFDTFEGLPTDWRPGFGRGAFRVENSAEISVPSNTVLLKGLFADTLPNHLRSMDDQFKCHTPVSFVHVDCDIYDGARDVLFLLGNRFVPGTIIVFDELFNYPEYEKHEIKALYEFLSKSKLRLIPLGAGSDIDLAPTKDKDYYSFGFVVAPKENVD